MGYFSTSIILTPSMKLKNQCTIITKIIYPLWIDHIQISRYNMTNWKLHVSHKNQKSDNLLIVKSF